MHWTRRADRPVSLPWRRIAGSGDILALIDAAGGGRRSALSDLSCGPVRGFHIAYELCCQLRLVVQAPLMLQPGPDADAGAALAPWIAGEGSGDFAALGAWQLARAMVAGLQDATPTDLLILAPRAGVEWGADNAQLLKFLALGLQGSAHRLCLLICGPQAPAALPAPLALQELPGATPAGEPADPAPRRPGPLAAVPGLVPWELVERLAADSPDEAILPLEGGLTLVAPEDRAASTALDAQARASLARAAAAPPAGADWGGYLAFALALAPFDAAGLELILRAAWHCVGSGGFAAARQLLRLAELQANPAQAAALAVAQLRMAVAAQRFDLAAAIDEPAAEGLAGTQLRDIRLGKGWGCIMSGNPGGARVLFERAGAPDPATTDPRDVVGLYLLNIYALVCLRNGAPAQALRLERAVEAALAGHGAPVWHLRYINALNIARLMLGAGDLDAAARYFRQGIAVLDGRRGETDQVLANLVQARMATAQGEAAAARQAVLRLCLHFLAMPVPEALGWRTAGTLLGGAQAAAVACGQALSLGAVEQVAAALEQRLRQACAACGQSLPEAAALAPAASQAGYGHAADVVPYTPEAPVRICAAPGWAVVEYAAVASLPPACEDAASQRLRALVQVALRLELGQHGLAGAVLIDPRGGRELAQDDAALLECAWRWQADSICVAGRAPWRLDAAMRMAAMQLAMVGPSASIARLEHADGRAVVHFHRNRPPLRLTERQLGGLAFLRGLDSLAARLGGALHAAAASDVLRSLDAAGLLHWDFAPALQRLGWGQDAEACLAG